MGFAELGFLLGHAVNISASAQATWRQNMFGWVDRALSSMLDTDTIFSAKITVKVESPLQDLATLCND